MQRVKVFIDFFKEYIYGERMKKKIRVILVFFLSNETFILWSCPQVTFDGTKQSMFDKLERTLITYFFPLIIPLFLSTKLIYQTYR